MSGIYITGMKMPTSSVPVLLCPDGKVFADLDGNWIEYKAFSVPDHGSLINANAVGDFLRNKYWNSPWVRSHILDKIVRDVKGFQAAIPADGGGGT